MPSGDRQLGAHVFDLNARRPDPVAAPVLVLRHPEVYIIALPFFGIISEILPVFSRKPIFGYVGLVGATSASRSSRWRCGRTTCSSPEPWNLPFFSGMTFLIAVPTGVKFFNWDRHDGAGSVRMDAHALVDRLPVTLPLRWPDRHHLASPPLDFHVSDSYFVVAHFHYVMFGTVVFAMFAGFYFWWPKMTGRMLDERSARSTSGCCSSASTPPSSSSTGWASRACRVGTPTTCPVTAGVYEPGLDDRRLPVLASSLLPFFNVYVSRKGPWSTPTTRGAGAGRWSGRRAAAAAPQLPLDPAHPLWSRPRSTSTTRRSPPSRCTRRPSAAGGRCQGGRRLMKIEA